MNDSELCGRVLKVAFARPQRFKEGLNKPIWMDEEFHKAQLNTEEQKKEQEKKLFA